MIPFTYVVLRYIHDNAAGESLNVGILLVSVDGHYADCRLEKHTSRLSATFRDFDATFHRQSMRSLEREVGKIRQEAIEGQASLFPAMNASTLIRALWPDLGLSYQASEVKAGSAKNLNQAIDALFDRFVTRQEPERGRRRGRADEDVWRDVQRQLPVRVAMRLRPVTIEAAQFEFTFDHAYRNGQLHVIEPLSFDLIETDRIRDKSLLWVGRSVLLRPFLGTLNFIVEGPGQEEMVPAYQSAIKILQGAANVFEIDQTDRLTLQLEHFMS